MKGSVQLLLMVVCVILPSDSVSVSFAKNWYRVIQLTACNATEPTIVHLQDFKMVEVKDEVVMMGSMIVDEDVQRDITMTIWVSPCDFEQRRCEERDTPMRFENFCVSMNSFTLFGTSFRKDIVPPLTCPFKKGTYRFNNVTANIGIVSRFPIGGRLWNAKISLLNKSNKVLFCGNTGILLKDVRRQFRG